MTRTPSLGLSTWLLTAWWLPPARASPGGVSRGRAFQETKSFTAFWWPGKSAGLGSKGEQAGLHFWVGKRPGRTAEEHVAGQLWKIQFTSVIWGEAL